MVSIARVSLLPWVASSAALGALALACGGPPQPVADPAALPPGVDPNAGAPITPGARPLAVAETAGGAHPHDAGVDVPTAEVGPKVPAPVASRSVEECTTLAKFEAPKVAGEGGAQVVPWMVDPFGDADAKKKGPKPDPRLAGIRADFRQCLKSAKEADPTQVVAIAMQHTPKGSEHKVCVKVNREDGREEVTRQLAQCLVQAIGKHAAR